MAVLRIPRISGGEIRQVGLRSTTLKLGPSAEQLIVRRRRPRTLVGLTPLCLVIFCHNGHSTHDFCDGYLFPGPCQVNHLHLDHPLAGTKNFSLSGVSPGKLPLDALRPGCSRCDFLKEQTRYEGLTCDTCRSPHPWFYRTPSFMALCFVVFLTPALPCPECASRRLSYLRGVTVSATTVVPNLGFG